MIVEINFLGRYLSMLFVIEMQSIVISHKSMLVHKYMCISDSKQKIAWSISGYRQKIALSMHKYRNYDVNSLL